MVLFSTWGTLLGLALAIFLITKKAHPAYSLMFGAFVGGLLSGASPAIIVKAMISGAQGMMPAVLRIISAGVLAGALIQSGAAEKIAETIVLRLGKKYTLTALAFASFFICAVGVFVDIVIITVAPIALEIAKKTHLSIHAVLLAMIGGGKSGNIVSPNPNTIAAAEGFNLDLSTVIYVNLIPALCGLVVSIALAAVIAQKRKSQKACEDLDSLTESSSSNKTLPTFRIALVGPLVVVCLLACRPFFGIYIDPLIALPLGGVFTIILTRNTARSFEILDFGLSKVIGVSVLLIGTGTISGIIRASSLQNDLIQLLTLLNVPVFVLAPLSGILFGAATASTTAGTTIAAQTFAPTLLSAGVPALSSAAMIHAGAAVIACLPHGSFFHASAGSVGMSTQQRIRLIPYEALIGLVITFIAILKYLVIS